MIFYQNQKKQLTPRPASGNSPVRSIHMVKRMRQAAFLFLALLLSAALMAETIDNHFDSPEDILKYDPQLKDPASSFVTDSKAAGGGCLRTNGRFEKMFKESPEGVLSFWVYDDYFEEIIERKLRQVNFSLLRNDEGKKEIFGSRSDVGSERIYLLEKRLNMHAILSRNTKEVRLERSSRSQAQSERSIA